MKPYLTKPELHDDYLGLQNYEVYLLEDIEIIYLDFVIIKHISITIGYQHFVCSYTFLNNFMYSNIFVIKNCKKSHTV